MNSLAQLKVELKKNDDGSCSLVFAGGLVYGQISFQKMLLRDKGVR